MSKVYSRLADPTQRELVEKHCIEQLNHLDWGGWLNTSQIPEIVQHMEPGDHLVIASVATLFRGFDHFRRELVTLAVAGMGFHAIENKIAIEPGAMEFVLDLLTSLRDASWMAQERKMFEKGIQLGWKTTRERTTKKLLTVPCWQERDAMRLAIKTLEEKGVLLEATRELNITRQWMPERAGQHSLAANAFRYVPWKPHMLQRFADTGKQIIAEGGALDKNDHIPTRDDYVYAKKVEQHSRRNAVKREMRKHALEQKGNSGDDGVSRPAGTDQHPAINAGDHH